MNAVELARAIKNDIIKSVTLAKIACILNDNELLDEALKIAKGLDLLHYSEALAEIAVVMAEDGRFEEALSMANEVVEERFRLNAMEKITFYLCDAGKFDKALSIAGKLRYRSQRALSNLAVRLAKDGDFRKSIEVVEAITEKSWKAETLAKIGCIFHNKRGDLFKEAVDVARSIGDEAIRSRTLLRIAVELAKAKKEYEDVLNEGLKIEKNDVDVLNLVRELAAIDEIDAALMAVGFIREKYWKVEALTVLANATSNAKILENAIEVAKSINDKVTSSESLLKIAAEISGERQDSIVKDAMENIKNTDEFLKSKVLTNAVIDFLRAGNINKALDFSENISDDIYKSEALFYISSQLARSKKIRDAMEVAKKISDDYWKSRALSNIAIFTLHSYDLQF